MKFIALAALPQGQKPGDVLDVSDEVGAVLVQFGVAKRVDESETKSKKGTYRRRDLVAEERTALTAEE